MLLKVQGQREVVREGKDASHELDLNVWHHIVWLAPLALIPYFCVGKEAFKLAPPDNRCVFQWRDVAKLYGKVILHALVNPSTQLAIVNGSLIYGLSVPIVERLKKRFRDLVGGGYLTCYAISIPSALIASPDLVQMAVDLASPPAVAPAAAATAGWIGYLDPLGIGRYSYKFAVDCFWSPAPPVPNNVFVPFCAGNAGAVYGLLAANVLIAVDNAYNDAVTEEEESYQQKSDDGKPEEEQSSHQNDAHQPAVAPGTNNNGKFWKILKKRMSSILLPVASGAAYFYFQRHTRSDKQQERTLDLLAMRGAATGAVMACVLLGREGFLVNGGAMNTITYLKDQMENLLFRTMGRFRRPVENVVNPPAPVPNAVDATNGNSLKI